MGARKTKDSFSRKIKAVLSGSDAACHFFNYVFTQALKNILKLHSQMDDSKNIIDKIGKGKLIAAACLIIFFLFNPDVFQYFFVAGLLFFPIYFVIARWLDKQ